MQKLLFFSLIIVMAAVMTLVGCQVNPQKANTTICSFPNILVGAECCLDQNNNSLCDSLETEKAVVHPEVPPKAEAMKSLPSITLLDLESGISQAYPRQKHNFTDEEKVNLTGIENTYNISSSGRFVILKIKEPFNYLNTEENYSDFVQRVYALQVKNDKIWASSEIDLKKYQLDDWKDMEYVYENSLQNIGDYLFEEHLLFFYRLNAVYQVYWDYYALVHCTPELVVKIYYPEYKISEFSAGGQVSDSKNAIQKKEQELQEEIIQVADTLTKICHGEDVQLFSNGREVTFYGIKGWEPQNLTIAAGEKVTFYNENEDWNGMLITFVQETPSRKVFISKVTKVGDSLEMTFDNPGNYTFFVSEYNDKGRIVVK